MADLVGIAKSLKKMNSEYWKSSGNLPAYVYDIDEIANRYDILNKAYHYEYEISYAVKSNPNSAVLEALCRAGALIDASSYWEIERALSAGAHPEQISFTGPGKRPSEIYGAIVKGIGALVLESPLQVQLSNEAAARVGVVQPVILRINPNKVPKAFGARMSGSASQFGIDEADAPGLIQKITKLKNLKLVGFHIYSGSNCLNESAIIENYQICRDVFISLSRAYGQPVSKLIFGSGLGVPYHDGQVEPDVGLTGKGAVEVLQELMAEPLLFDVKCSLELGRWLVGPAGYLFTSVLDKKPSRDKEIIVCDAGFNVHMAACGMLGSVLRKNWPISNVSVSKPDAELKPYMLVGPLCTSIDLLSREYRLPETQVGDILCIAMSGAYGLTASPTRFISHPEAKEYALKNNQLLDVTESSLNTYILR